MNTTTDQQQLSRDPTNRYVESVQQQNTHVEYRAISLTLVWEMHQDAMSSSEPISLKNFFIYNSKLGAKEGEVREDWLLKGMVI